MILALMLLALVAWVICFALEVLGFEQTKQDYEDDYLYSESIDGARHDG